MSPIRIAVIDPLNSPLEALLRLCSTHYSTSPERPDQLVLELQGVTFKIIQDREFTAYYLRAGEEITLFFPVVGLLWCIAYVYIVLLDVAYPKRDPDDRVPTDLTTDPIWIHLKASARSVALKPLRAMKAVER